MKELFIKPNKIMAVLCYVLAILILPSLLACLIAVFVCSAKGTDFGEVVNLLLKSNDALASEAIIESKYISYGWAEFVSYALGTGFACFFLRDLIKADLIKFKENLKRNIIQMIVVGCIFCGIAFGISELFTKIAGDSNNQSTIIMLLKYDSKIPVIISVVLFAPIIEELIYRKCIFDYFKKYNIIVCFILSVILFSLPHMLSKTATFTIWILQLIPYMLDALLLCLIYYFGKENTCHSWFAHFMNNLLSAILALA